MEPNREQVRNVITSGAEQRTEQRTEHRTGRSKNDRSALARDFKLQYVCALGFLVRAVGMVGSALTLPSTAHSYLVKKPLVAAVFGVFVVFYACVAVAMRLGKLRFFTERPALIVLDLLSVGAVNLWSASQVASLQIDAGGNDVFWMAMIGSVSVWSALHDRVTTAALMVFSSVIVVAMFRANDVPIGDINWPFAISRIVFVGIGVMATTAALRISESYEEFRRQDGLRHGEKQALGAMHRRALQDLKVISRLASESHGTQERLDEIKQHAAALAEYVRTWSTRHDTPLDIEDAIHQAVEDANATERVMIRVVGTTNAPVSKEMLLALREAVGESVSNVMQHAPESNSFVHAHLSEESGVLRVQIADTGPGFDPSDRRTTHGLGLSRIVELIQSVGGSAELRTAPGCGTTWTLITHAYGTPKRDHSMRARIIDLTEFDPPLQTKQPVTTESLKTRSR
jgi:two-component sensor histidine kinase